MKLSGDDIMNWWLKKYHDITLDEIVAKHPEWDDDNEGNVLKLNYPMSKIIVYRH